MHAFQREGPGRTVRLFRQRGSAAQQALFQALRGILGGSFPSAAEKKDHQRRRQGRQFCSHGLLSPVLGQPCIQVWNSSSRQPSSVFTMRMGYSMVKISLSLPSPLQPLRS